jgi:hypothetical protein
MATFSQLGSAKPSRSVQRVMRRICACGPVADLRPYRWRTQREVSVDGAIGQRRQLRRGICSRESAPSQHRREFYVQLTVSVFCREPGRLAPCVPFSGRDERGNLRFRRLFFLTYQQGVKFAVLGRHARAEPGSKAFFAASYSPIFSSSVSQPQISI